MLELEGRDLLPHSQINPLPDLLGPQSHPSWALRCARSALQLPTDKKRGVFRHFSKRFLKTCGGTPKGGTVCMNQSRAFWMHQVNEM